MLRATIDTIVPMVAGDLLAGSSDAVVAGLATDSREVRPGMLFVALAGERADGHDFLGEVVARGARAVIVSRHADELGDVLAEASERGVAVIRVEDGLRAIQSIAAWHRGRLHCPVVGITGSTGKTTTKDLLTSVLRQRFGVVATEGNRNNELGVPLTILEAEPNTEIVVVEMGMRGVGQIAALCAIARPTVGLVTNVGTSHIELLETREAVADAKAELAAAVPEDGLVFLNGDDAYADRIAGFAHAPIVRYGLAERCAFRGEDVVLDAESHPTFALVTPEESFEVAVPVPGRHNVYNALAAASVALSLGCEADDVAAGLEAAELTGMRMEVFEAACGVTVVNDAYNANPTSMRAAVETLAAMRPEGRRIAVLGDMAELGSLTELAHFRIGELVGRLPIDVLVTIGPRAARIAEGALAGGMGADVVRRCVTVEEASEVLDDVLRPGDAVLVKASRVMGLERVVDGIVSPRV